MTTTEDNNDGPTLSSILWHTLLALWIADLIVGILLLRALLDPDHIASLPTFVYRLISQSGISGIAAWGVLCGVAMLSLPTGLYARSRSRSIATGMRLQHALSGLALAFFLWANCVLPLLTTPGADNAEVRCVIGASSIALISIGIAMSMIAVLATVRAWGAGRGRMEGLAWGSGLLVLLQSASGLVALFLHGTP